MQCVIIIRANDKSQMHTLHCIYNTDRSEADSSARGQTNPGKQTSDAIVLLRWSYHTYHVKARKLFFTKIIMAEIIR